MGCRYWTVAWAVSAAIVLAEQPVSQELEAGKQSYTTLCAGCHGPDGDALSYADIVPVAGINRRYPPEVTGQLSGMFSGRILHGLDRERVVRYMSTLRGAKDFPDPGWLVTPYLLERKAPRIHQFRVLDARPAEAYRAGHAANAVSVPPESCLSEPAETVEWLGQLGVTPTTMVIVYDDVGGPAAACVWWRIRRAGHPYVAVLDGGWKKSLEENRYKTAVLPKIQPAVYTPFEMALDPRPVATSSILRLAAEGWDWRRIIDENGFPIFRDLLQRAEHAGLRSGAAFRVDGPEDQVAHLALTVSLLGYQADYDTATRVLSLRSR